MNKGFPNEYYAFTDGEISITVERFGGINTICCLDLFEKNGKFYPDRGYTPIIFMKEGKVCGKRYLYGPAMQFISTNTFPDGTKGRNFFHVPDNVKLYPFGFESESNRFGYVTRYNMCINRREVLWSFSNEFPTRENFIVSINKDHIVQGKIYTLKNQLPDVTGKFQATTPFKDDQRYVEQKWDFIGYDEHLNGFILDGVIKFLYGDKKVVVLITADQKIIFFETKCRYFLMVPWQKLNRIKLCLVVSESRKEALNRSQAIFNNFNKIFANKIKNSISYSRKATNLDSEGFPEVKTFSKTAPSFLKAMVLAETEKEACIRAATHKYGFFVGWDQVWPAKAFMLMGDWEIAKKLLRYHITLDGTEDFDIAIINIINTTEDFIGISGDICFLKEVYPEIKKLFCACLSRVSDNGFLKTSNTTGVDDPTEIGINNDIWAADVNGWWYSAVRAMENMALIVNDKKIVKQAGAIGEKIKDNYLKIFFDKKIGYLYSSVDPKTKKGIPIYQNVSTITMDSPYGESLLQAKIEQIAKFHAFQLYHPAGRSAVAYWDEAHEMWKNCIMYQHLVHEMKTARAAGYSDEIIRMMTVYLGHFSKNKVAIETHNLVGAEGDITQRANWQSFGTRALYSGIIEGLIGIQYDLGGFYYVPCNINAKMSISNFRFRKSIWKITIKGEGEYAKEFVIDNNSIHGSMKIPTKYLTDNKSHILTIERSKKPFHRPTLLLATGAGIDNLHSKRNELSFTVTAEVHTTIKVYSPFKPQIKIGNQKIYFGWDEKRNYAWIDTIVKPSIPIVITTLQGKKTHNSI